MSTVLCVQEQASATNKVTYQQCLALFIHAGVPGSHSKPYVRSKGKKFEHARGRRRSCGYKV